VFCPVFQHTISFLKYDFFKGGQSTKLTYLSKSTDTGGLMSEPNVR